MIADNYRKLLNELKGKARLIVVSKYRTPEEILQVYLCGHREFGENRVQALLERREILPADIRWHLIGHLQSNKVKYIAPFVELIHSIDSVKLLAEVNRRAAENNRVIDVLLQMHIAREETKAGLEKEELQSLLAEYRSGKFPNTRICGLMGMATNSREESVIRPEFEGLYALYHQLKHSEFAGQEHFSILSMGMSSDYSLAIECGSNMVRVGSRVFEN